MTVTFVGYYPQIIAFDHPALTQIKKQQTTAEFTAIENAPMFIQPSKTYPGRTSTTTHRTSTRTHSL